MRSIRLIFLALLITCFLPGNIFAASDAAVLFLLLSPSPRANGLGNTFMALPDNDAMAPCYNPASLGLFALEHRFSVGFYPQRINWLPGLMHDLYYDCKSINLGFRLPQNLSAGVGYYRIYVDLGEQMVTDEQGNPIRSFSPQEKAQAVTFGVGINHRVKVGLGFTAKYIYSNLGALYDGQDLKTAKADAYAFDLGGMVQVPILELLKTRPKLYLDQDYSIRPFFTTALGYSMSNIGDAISYIDEQQKDPLPRTARLGYSFDMGMILNQKKLNWKLSSFRWAIEAEDLLIKERIPPDYDISYQFGLGDINFFHDLLLGGKNAKIFQMRGWEVNCLEMLYLRQGSYEDQDGKVFYHTKGIGLSLTGFLKFASFFFPHNPNIIFLVEHVDLQYHWSKMEIGSDHPLYGTEFKGLNLVIK